jgi:light-regulated signal transduction histidine kinase (bacteriophytochrome)
LNEYTNLLKKSNEDLGNFAYAVSHDLKAPLNTVRGILNIIDNNKEEPNCTNKLEHIRIAKLVVDQMTRLIKDLLDYSRIDTKNGHFSIINLHEIINYILLLLNEKITKNNATILINPLPQIYGERTLINELFLNLLNNALIYHNNNTVEIEVGFEEEQEFYKFYIRDNGIGIQEKEFEKIFVIFKRLHTQGEFAGTGIGLALCKRIVEFHKGKIWVESEYGKGSTFYFTIKKES